MGQGEELAFYSRCAGGVTMREPVAASCRRGCLATVVEVTGKRQGVQVGGTRKGSLGVEQEEDI